MVIGLVEINAVTKQSNDTKHCSTNLTPIDASSKNNEGYVCQTSLDDRRELN